LLRESVMATIRGRFVREDGSPVPAKSHFPDESGPGPICMLEPVNWANSQSGCEPTDDGGLQIVNVTPGKYWLRAFVPGGGSIREIDQGTRDITDEPLDVRSESQDRITITLGSIPTRLDVDVRDSLGHPQEGVLVAIFSTTATRWWLPASRYVTVRATDFKGAFHVEGLPPDDYYVAPATEVSDEWFPRSSEVDPDV